MVERLKSWIDFLWMISIAPIILCIPCNRKKIVFGAWMGRQFSDNPKYFLKWIAENTDYKCYWIGRQEIKPQVGMYPKVHFVKRNTPMALWHWITAGWTVCNINPYSDIMRFPTYGRSKNLNLWHGTSLKKIGEAQYNGKGESPSDFVPRKSSLKGCLALVARIRQLKHKIQEWAMPQTAYTSCANRHMVEILHRSFPMRFAEQRAVLAGQPRNDFLVANREDDAIKKKLKEKYGRIFGVPNDKRWYLYLPTWRHDLEDTFSFLRSQHKPTYQRLLESQGAVLIEKQHPIILLAKKLGGAHEGNIHVLPSSANEQIDMQELLLASDRLITDYSSCFFDFEVLKRPTIHFAYDYQKYATMDSGVEYELSDIAAGPVVETEVELLSALTQSDDVLWNSRGKKADEPIAAESGYASERFAHLVGIKIKSVSK